jgi:hypothetical protein
VAMLSSRRCCRAHCWRYVNARYCTDTRSKVRCFGCICAFSLSLSLSDTHVLCICRYWSCERRCIGTRVCVGIDRTSTIARQVFFCGNQILNLLLLFVDGRTGWHAATDRNPCTRSTAICRRHAGTLCHLLTMVL